MPHQLVSFHSFDFGAELKEIKASLSKQILPVETVWHRTQAQDSRCRLLLSSSRTSRSSRPTGATTIGSFPHPTRSIFLQTPPPPPPPPTTTTTTTSKPTPTLICSSPFLAHSIFPPVPVVPAHPWSFPQRDINDVIIQFPKTSLTPI